jgi:outer membrane protein OmpA-like peptidoglycan-associated protein
VDGKVILTGVVASEAARAQAVDFAKQSFGADLAEKGANAADLSAAGYGADKPIASNGSTEGKAQNRRQGAEPAN